MAGAECRRGRGYRSQVRSGLAGLGAPQDRRDDARQRLRGVHLDPWKGRCAAAGCCCRPGSALTADPRARLRKRVFREAPRQRNRVWQTDFSEFETARGGIWRIYAVIDYATKYCLAATVTPTSRGADALACLRRAVVEAERVLDLDDLRDRPRRDGRRRRRRLSSSVRRRRRSRWSPTTARASAAARLRRGVHRRRPAAAGTSAPG